MAPKLKPRIAANGYRLCDPLPKGEVLIDSTNKQWILGTPIGCGGFGEIYSCSRSGDKTEYVMKLDNIEGPLFAEMNFYIRVGKEEYIKDWMAKNGLRFLGIPKYIASGIHDKSSKSDNRSYSSAKAKKSGPTLQYRFLVMQRFGDELQKLIIDKKLTTSKACDIACNMIDVLQYIHSFGYIHADIKATNILRSNIKASKTGDEKYYLVDYGLAERFKNPNGTHREEKPDKKRANNGTVEFRSRDAHIGLISRRSDIECLAYNLIQWLYGTLPWIKSLNDVNKVQDLKEYFMNNIEGSLGKCFAENRAPNGLKDLFKEINRIKYDSEPNYRNLRNILKTKVAKSKPIVDEDDNEDDEEEELRRTKKRRSVSKTRNNRISPKKSVKKKSNDSNVITLDDSDDDEDGRAEGLACSPPKRVRNTSKVTLIKERNNNCVSPQRTGRKGRHLPRYSTPLLIHTDSEDSSSHSIEGNSNTTAEEEGLNGGASETPAMIDLRKKLKEKKDKELENKKNKRKASKRK